MAEQPHGDKPKRNLREAAPVYVDHAANGKSGGPGKEVILAVVLVAAAAAGIMYFKGDPNSESTDTTDSPSLTDAGSGEGTTSSAEQGDATELSKAAHAIFEKRCAQCHSVKMVAEGFNVMKHDVLLQDDTQYVVAGNLEDSGVWQRMGVDKDMPPEEVEPATAEEIDTIGQWIEAGAAPFPTETSRPFIAEADAWKLVLADLEGLSRTKRQYARYFSFVNLHNNSFDDRIGRNNTNYPGKNLQLSRAALAKLVNSLSWMTDIVVPEAIDADQLVFRIDLRELGWYDRVVWDEIQRSYPYGLDLMVNADEEIRTVAEQIYELSDSKLPIVRGDWFIDTAPRGTLYYDILGLPGTVQELEQQLGVDTDEDFNENRLRRAGFTESGVSQSNRLVDRHPTEDGGYYWKSYDFGKSESRGNLFKFPLGPKFATNHFQKFAFEADGGEMIFSLPNGLQAYYLADASGNRLDAGPVEVVRDNKETSGTPAVVNAVSCMACHQHGMIRFQDTVRASRSVPFGEVRLKVDELFPPQDEMSQILDQDAAPFLAALELAAGSFLKVGENADKQMQDFTEEPIGTSARYYQKDLEIEEVAAELGQSDPTVLATLIRNNSRLRELGLAPLAAGAGIKRSTWASTGESLFHALAAELEIGTAVK